MCDERAICARLSLWHWKHVSISATVLSWNLGDTTFMMVWQLVQATARVSWVLPFQ